MISRVYVIDDDHQFRNSLCALIESVGLEVEGWGNPEDLLKKSSLHRPSCVVLDHRLPLLSGLEVLRIIRKTSSIPAILISAYADVQTAVAAMEMGASTVFEKPVDDNAFLNALERFCFEDAQPTLKRQLCLAIQEEIAKLSEVERSTLEQMQLGLSNKAIPRKLSRASRIAPLRNVATRVREIAGGARNPGTKPRRDSMMSALARARLRRACGHARREHRPRAKGRRGTRAGARRVRDKRSKSGLTPSTSEGFPLVPSLFFPLAANVA